jgi:simple sugar transport system ATP-binding protein
MLHPSAGGFSVQGCALAGREPGEVTRAGVGIVPEDRHEVGCILPMSVADNLFLNQMKPFVRFGLVDRDKQRGAARERMAAFDVRASGPDAPFSSLSGGNQQKAVLARELNVPGLAVLVAAQPTRGLDVGAVEAVHERLRAAARAGVAVLMISSELDDLLAVADRILVMFRGRVTGECPAHPTQRERIGALMAGHA